MKLRILLIFIAFPLLAADNFESFLKPLFKDSCIQCHGLKGKVKGKVNLLDIKNRGEFLQNPDLIQEVYDAIEAGDMPPEDEKPLTSEVKKRLLSEIKKLLHESVASLKSTPTTEIRRMNRFQYSNAVEDLFGMKVEVFPLPEKMMREHGNYFQPAKGVMPKTLKAGSRPLGKSQLISRRLAGVAPFPQDLRAEHGFDNRGDHLTLSPILMESFLKLSRSIVNSDDFNQKNVGIWKTFFTSPQKDHDQQIKSRLKSFLRKAFRRKVDDNTLSRYTTHVKTKIKAGISFTDAMKSAVSAVLASPRFFYIYDGGITGSSPEKIDDFELASRMSYFLWGSIPDNELLDLAEAGSLHKSKTLIEQINRMLKDRKLKRFCDSFASQWLQMERIISSTPDKKQFPKFYFSRFRHSMRTMLEPLLLFETVLIENRSILDFIDADYGYQGSGGPSAISFTRKKFKDRRSGGIITNEGILTMTSGSSRTHPITRGAWMATVIFNDPPKPPPADVPTLPEKESLDDSLTIRERFEKHRSREDCKSCHAQIDPLGFALENYDAVGKWREKYRNGRAVDASGVLYKKHKFSNIVEFKDAVLKEKERFLKGFSEHLLSFALGRHISAADTFAVEKIVKKGIENEYKLQPLLKEVIMSQPFLNKFNPAGVAANAK